MQINVAHYEGINDRGEGVCGQVVIGKYFCKIRTYACEICVEVFNCTSNTLSGEMCCLLDWEITSFTICQILLELPDYSRQQECCRE